MKKSDLISQKTADCSQIENINCAQTTLKVLSDIFNVQLETQTFIAATGLNGAGEYGAQCGLVDGTLMFLGIIGNIQALSKEKIAEMCRTFAEEFEARFGSLLCVELRPEGFKEDNPPDLCNSRICEAIHFAYKFIEKQIIIL
ncbi:C-GCAxxG-C-C family protein [Patescibacteria group bacterium]